MHIVIDTSRRSNPNSRENKGLYRVTLYKHDPSKPSPDKSEAVLFIEGSREKIAKERQILIDKWTGTAETDPTIDAVYANAIPKE